MSQIDNMIQHPFCKHRRDFTAYIAAIDTLASHKIVITEAANKLLHLANLVYYCRLKLAKDEMGTSKGLYLSHKTGPNQYHPIVMPPSPTVARYTLSKRDHGLRSAGEMKRAAHGNKRLHNLGSKTT